MPEPESAQVKFTVTFELFHPLALGAGEATAVIVGGVLSIFTERVAAEVLPALSMTDPVTGVVPSAVTVTAAGQVPARPESASEQVKVTVTFELFQPLAFGAGDCSAVMIEGVLSRLIVTLVVAVFPAVSVAVPETTWFAPSVLTITGDGQVCIGLLPAVQVNVTVTFELFQPLAFGPGEATAVIVGGVVPG